LEDGIQIDDEVWNEFVLYAKVVYQLNPDADLYDVFNFIREQQGNLPFSGNFLKIIDREIVQDERRDIRRAQKVSRKNAA
jgi:hypothetical protein